MERPLERRTSIRTAVVWDVVRRHLGDRNGLEVVDIGGGTGGFAVRVAGLGHRVTVVDPSPDALAALDRRAREDGVSDLVSGRQGDLADLGASIPPGSAQLVLCHEVLGLVDDPEAALVAIRQVLAPDGALSLLVSQRHHAVLARAMAGQFDEAQALLAGAPTAGERRFTAPEVAELVAGAGLRVVEQHAVRVFADLVPSPLLDLEPGAVQGLLDLERAVAARPEYLAVGAQVHTLAEAG